MAGSAPLHKTVHWRRLRDLIQMLCDYEHINCNDYDLQHIVCRKTIGSMLHGHNVSYDMCDNGRSYFVTDNNYEVFEIGKKTNKKNSIYGSFLVLIHNTDFNYWLFGNMKVGLNANKSRATQILSEKYFYDILGQYNVTLSEKPTFRKTRRGDNISFGNAENDLYCGGLGRKQSYNTSDSEILNNLGVKNKTNNLSGGSTVKIYKKSKRNTTKRRI
jgi:hypothetical protein